MPDWPAGRGAAWGRGLPCSPAAADPGERARAGQGPGIARPAGPAPLGVLDAPGREPIIGRRGTGAGMRLWWLRAPWAAPVLARLAAVIPPGKPAARGRGAWGWSARAAGSIRRPAAARGGARHGSDHALPAAGLLTG